MANERKTTCGFCIDGVFTVRARGLQPKHTIPCPYCNGTGWVDWMTWPKDAPK